MKRNRLHAILLGAALAVLAFPTAADAASSEVSVRGRPPHAAAPAVAAEDADPSTHGTQIAPRAGQSRALAVRVDVEDDNGHNDVRQVRVGVYLEDRTTAHLPEVAAAKVNGHGRLGVWVANVAMRHYDAPGTYWLRSEVTDRDGSVVTSWSNFTYDSLAAVQLDRDEVAITSPESGGAAVLPGADTFASPAEMQVTNAGNVPVSVTYMGTDMTNATTGAAVPVGSLYLSRSPDMTGAMPFRSDARVLENADLAPGPEGSLVTYFAVRVPQGIPTGDYRGTMTISATPVSS